MTNNQLLSDFKNLLIQFKEGLFNFLPEFILAVLVLLAGILIAKLIRVLINRSINKLPGLIPNKKTQNRLKQLIIDKPIVKIIGGVVFWILVLFFLAAATEILGLPVITVWLSGITSYLPRILAAVLIGTAGIIAGVIIRDLVITTATSAGIVYGSVLGRLAQIIIILLTGLIAFDQIGINVSILINLIVIIIGALLFGAAFAFGLGARESVSNILASYYLQKIYKVGQVIQIRGQKGRIIEITPTAVILEAPEGQLYIPAKEFNEETSILFVEEK